MHEAYVTEGGLDRIPSFVEDTGEVNWLVADALRMETPIPVISQAVMLLFASRDDRKNWARAIATRRLGFGGLSAHDQQIREGVADVDGVMIGVAAASTGSAAMLAETSHSIADTGNQALLFLGLCVSDRRGC